MNYFVFNYAFICLQSSNHIYANENKKADITLNSELMIGLLYKI